MLQQLVAFKVHVANKDPKCISMFTDRPLVHPAPTLVQSQRKGEKRAPHLVSITWHDLTKMVEVSSSLKWSPDWNPTSFTARTGGSLQRYQFGFYSLSSDLGKWLQITRSLTGRIWLLFFIAVGLWDYQPAMMVTRASRLAVSQADMAAGCQNWWPVDIQHVASYSATPVTTPPL